MPQLPYTATFQLIVPATSYCTQQLSSSLSLLLYTAAIQRIVPVIVSISYPAHFLSYCTHYTAAVQGPVVIAALTALTSPGDTSQNPVFVLTSSLKVMLSKMSFAVASVNSIFGSYRRPDTERIFPDTVQLNISGTDTAHLLPNSVSRLLSSHCPPTARPSISSAVQLTTFCPTQYLSCCPTVHLLPDPVSHLLSN